VSLAAAVACSKASSKGAEPAASSEIADPFLTPSPLPPPSSSSSPSTSALASPSASGAPSGSPGLSPRASVKLLDPGREPRRALRYAFRTDQKELMSIELSMSIAVEGGGARSSTQLPPLEIAIAIDPQTVSPAGDLRFAWRVTSAELGALDASTSPDVTQGWSAQLAPVAHLSGTASVSSHGISRGLIVDAGSAGDAGTDQEMVAQVLQMVRDAAAPLPEEPVGPGARWQKVTTLEARNGQAVQNDTFTLVALQGDSGQLADVFAQTASSRTPPAPSPSARAAPAPAAAQMDQLLSSGDEKVRFDLGRFVAQTSLEGTTSMAMSAPSARMNMVMHLGVTVRGTTP
jgi:hypothetical protein